MHDALKSDAWRIAWVGVVVTMEIAAIGALVTFLGASAAPVFVTLQALSGITLIALMGSSENGAYRTAWMGCVLVLGLAGVLAYLLFGRRHLSRPAKLSRENMQKAQTFLKAQQPAMPQWDDLVMRGLSARGFPAYAAQECTYFATGEAFLVSLLADIAQAKTSVELEFFICSPGKILEKLLKICTQAHERGVEIRLLIDDAGTLLKKDAPLKRRFEAAGVEVRVFNPIVRNAPLLTLNFRDHRKIAVIDGQIAYTGGVNLADEYANLQKRYGYWKDTGVRLTGEAVRSFSLFFTALWAAAGGQRLGTAQEKRVDVTYGADGLVQPYQSGPAISHRADAPAVYAMMILGARNRVWLTTPYLLPDEMLESALCLCAQSGADVRIILPGKPDHPLVALAGESHYAVLLRSGVKLYRYTPGFIHAKMCLCDDDLASIGTVNLDFRSLYLHFEDGVILHNVAAVEDMRADMEAMMRESERIEWRCVVQAPPLRRVLRALLRMISPML